MEVNLFPSETEILSTENDMTCKICKKKIIVFRFANSSACRFHGVRAHGIVLNDGDRRIHSSSSFKGEKTPNNLLYHCPASECRRRNVKFNGLRHLRQHYIRSHTEKRFVCNQCHLFKSALQKDLLYHQKKRCLYRDKANDKSKPKLTKKTPICADQAETSETTNQLRPSSSLIQPVIIVVPAANIASTLEEIKKALRRTSEASVQVQNMPSTSQIDSQIAPNMVSIGVGPTQSYQNTDYPSGSYFYEQNNDNQIATNENCNGMMRMDRATAVEPIRTLSAYTQVAYYAPQQQQTDSAQYEYPGYSEISSSSSSNFARMADEGKMLIRDAGTSMQDPSDYYRNMQTQTTWNDIEELISAEDFPCNSLGC